MSDYHPNNERIKRRYLNFAKEAQGYSEATVNIVSMAIARFEKYTRNNDFRLFNDKQAVGFKYFFLENPSARTGKRPALATAYSTLSHLKRFFRWLGTQPGYRSKVNSADAEYFNLSDKDARIATAKRDREVPTVDQIMQVLRSAPVETLVQRRDRALVAFSFLSGARDGAVASMRLKHVDVDRRKVHQDAREVKTKFSNTFTSYFFPVHDEVLQIVEEWVAYRHSVCIDVGDAPLFPAEAAATIDDEHNFRRVGLSETGWQTTGPVCAAFRRTFEAAGVPYFHPHSFRHTLGLWGQAWSKDAEQMKAWSQNLGHASVMTTLYSYGTVAATRQGELLLHANQEVEEENPELKKLIKEVLKVVRNEGARIGPFTEKVRSG